MQYGEELHAARLAVGAELSTNVDGWLIVAVEVNLRAAQARAEGPKASMNGIKFLYTNVGRL